MGETKITKQPTIAAAWNSYRQMVLHPQAPEVQVSECRLAYYAGATTLFYAILDCLDPGDEPTAADMARMDRIHQEIDAFAATFDGEVTRRRG